MVYNPKVTGGKRVLDLSGDDSEDPSVVRGLIGGLVKAVSAPATVVSRALDPAVREVAQGADQLFAKTNLPGSGNSRRNVAARKAAKTTGFSPLEILRGIADAATSAPVALGTLGQSSFSPSERMLKSLGVKPVNDVSLFADPALQDNPRFVTGTLQFGLSSAEDPLSYVGVGRAGGLAERFSKGTALRLGSKELPDDLARAGADLLLKEGATATEMSLGARAVKAAGEVRLFGKGSKKLSEETIRTLGEMGYGERRALTFGLPGAKQVMEIPHTETVADVLDSVFSLHRSGVQHLLSKGTYDNPEGLSKLIAPRKRMSRETFIQAAEGKAIPGSKVLKEPVSVAETVTRLEALGLRTQLVGPVDTHVGRIVSAVNEWAQGQGFGVGEVQRDLRGMSDRGVSVVLQGLEAVKAEKLYAQGLEGGVKDAVAGLTHPGAKVAAQFLKAVDDLPLTMQKSLENGSVLDIALGGMERQPGSVGAIDLMLGRVKKYADDLAAKQRNTFRKDIGAGTTALNVVEKAMQDVAKEHFSTMEGRNMLRRLVDAGLDAPNLGVTDDGAITAARPAVKQSKVFADLLADAEVKRTQKLVDARMEALGADQALKATTVSVTEQVAQVLAEQERVLTPLLQEVKGVKGKLREVQQKIVTVDGVATDPVTVQKQIASGGSVRAAAVVKSLGLDDTLDNLAEKTAAHEAAIRATQTKTATMRALERQAAGPPSPMGAPYWPNGQSMKLPLSESLKAQRARIHAVREFAYQESDEFARRAEEASVALAQAKESFLAHYGSVKEMLQLEGVNLSEGVDQYREVITNTRELFAQQVRAQNAQKLAMENALSAAQRKVRGALRDPEVGLIGQAKGNAASIQAKTVEAEVLRTTSGALKVTGNLEWRLRNLKFDAFAGFDADEDFLRNMLALDHKNMVDLGLGYYMDESLYKFISRTATTEDATKGLLSNLNAVTKLWRASVLMMPGFSNRNFIGGFLQNLNDGVGIGEYRSAAKAYKSLVRFSEKNFADQSRQEVTLNLLRSGKIQWPQEVIDAARKYGLNEMDIYNTYRQIGEVLGKDVSSRAAIEGNRLLSKIERIQGVMDTSNPFSFKAIATLGAGQGVPVEMNLRLAHYFRLRSQGMTDFSALDRMYLLHNDYSDLSAIDIKAKRFFPFWTWRTRNLPLQAQLLSTTSVAGRALQVQAWKSQASAIENDGAFPPWIPGSSLAFGGGSFMGAQGFMGSSDLFDQVTNIAKAGKSGSLPALLQSIAQPESLGPAFKVPLEMITNRQSFTGQSITSPENTGGENLAAQAQYLLDALLPPLATLKRTKDSPSLDGPAARALNLLGFPVARTYGEG